MVADLYFFDELINFIIEDVSKLLFCFHSGSLLGDFKAIVYLLEDVIVIVVEHHLTKTLTKVLEYFHDQRPVLYRNVYLI